MGSIPGSGRSPGEGNGNPLQYSCLGNPTDREAWQKSMGSQRVGHDLVTKEQQQCIAIIVYFDPYIVPILSQAPLQSGFCIFVTSSFHFLSTSIFSSTKCFRLILFFTCPSLVSHFLQGPLVPLVKNGIQKPRSGLCSLIATGVSVLPGPFSGSN